MKVKMKNSQRQEGVTIIEITAFFLIIGIIAMASWTKYKEVRVRSVQGVLTTAATNVKTSYTRFLLRYSTKPSGIAKIGGEYYWVNKFNHEPIFCIVQHLGDFIARYDFDPPRYKGKVRITILDEGPNARWLKELDIVKQRRRYVAVY